jgi:TonB family protein
VGRRHSERHVLAAAFAEPRVLLERRVRALLQWPRGRRPLAASVLGGAALLCFGFAYAAPTPLARPEPAPPPAAAAGLQAPQDTQPQLRNAEEIRRLMQSEVPAALRALRQAGSALVAVHVSETGSVTEARLSQGSGRVELDSAALRVARRMVFTPARRGGQAVATWTRIPLVFGAAYRGGQVLPAAPRTPRDSVPPATPRPGTRLEDGPTFTPMTRRPELTNAAAVQQLLVAEYPPALKAAGVGGTAAVWHLIGADGRVLKAVISTTSGHAELDSAAVRVAQRMVFTPAEYQGERVAVWVEIPIVFTTRDAPSPGAPPAREQVFTPMPVTPEPTRQPVFTPMTVRPELTNSAAITQLLKEAYPPLLRDAGIGGRVSVWLYLNDNGVVQRLQVSQSSGRAELDQAALRVASGMRFTPAYNRDQRVPVWIELPVIFTPQGGQGGQQQAVRKLTVEQRPLVNTAEVQAALVRNYPPLLRDAGIGGQVVVWMYVEANGEVTKTQVAKPSGYPALDEAALKLAPIMRFRPAPTADWIEVPVTFSAK